MERITFIELETGNTMGLELTNADGSLVPLVDLQDIADSMLEDLGPTWSIKEPPLKAVHPGTILLEDFMIPSGVSTIVLAQGGDLPRSYIGAIIDGHAPVTTSVAAHLAEKFGTSAKFWTNLQKQYELDVSKGG